MASAGAHPWRIQTRALSGVFWACAYTARDFVKSGAILTALWKFLS